VGVVGWCGVVSGWRGSWGEALRMRVPQYWLWGARVGRIVSGGRGGRWIPLPDVGELDERALQRSVGFDAFVSHVYEELAVAWGPADSVMR
jgi:hypothetical protein